MTEHQEAEFDSFVDEYHNLHEKSIAASGEDPEFFHHYKIAVIFDRLGNILAKQERRIRILDYGSGVGNSTKHFLRYFPDAQIVCVDTSSKSLTVASCRYGKTANYVCIGPQNLPFAPGVFDIVFAACVFHHIPHSIHCHILSQLQPLLRPAGWLVVFEHNPLNPLTVSAVRRCPFDQNAVLIGARAMQKRIKESGYRCPEIDYRIFFPAFAARLRPLERWLSRIPFGAQYSVFAQRS